MPISPISAVGVEEDESESCHVSEKKRRLNVDQVKALEKNFEVENKLEPERKAKLAQELGLQPRQVAVWFQNRRARWKTKQLERDYGALKAEYDALKLNFKKLHRENEALKEIRDLKLLLKENGEEKENEGVVVAVNPSSDSDSSGIVNEDNNGSSPTAAISSSGEILRSSPPPPPPPINPSFEISGDPYGETHPHFAKIEEHNFLGEETCTTFFSDDQAPTLHWYSGDEWN